MNKSRLTGRTSPDAAKKAMKTDLDKPKYIRILVYPLYLYKKDGTSHT